MTPDPRIPILRRLLNTADDGARIMAADPARRERFRAIIRALIELFLDAMIRQFTPMILSAFQTDENPEKPPGSTRS